MYTIGTVFIGLVIGTLAMFVTRTPVSGGLVLNLVLGVAGALAVYYLGLGLHWFTPSSPGGAIAAVVGAMIMVLGFRVAVGRRTPAWR
jgi:uncharacterized membrane protein YeaQ/YmgE (transglycosylase-associated protein family)